MTCLQEAVRHTKISNACFVPDLETTILRVVTKAFLACVFSSMPGVRSSLGKFAACSPQASVGTKYKYPSCKDSSAVMPARPENQAGLRRHLKNAPVSTELAIAQRPKTKPRPLLNLLIMLSSQAIKGVPLDHAPADRGTAGYRLLELPPDLLTLLESSTPPTLRLASTPTAALLRAPDGRTWSLLQKNTSNALILLRANPQDQSLSAVATVHETVELVPEAQSAAAPTSVVRGKWHEKFGKTR